MSNEHCNFDFKKVTIYLVGGAVRDRLLGIEPKDLDYVVIGSSPEEMLKLGFQQVGADFPVFLHPETKNEYALGRTERKTGTGYDGFECEWKGVTIEEDLSRRDLTINAIAIDCSRNLGKIIDPYNGRADIKNKFIRPVTDAFKEDPLRVLRAARFMARYTDFKPHPDLWDMCYDVQKELLHLTPERVWKETEKALSEVKPSKYFEWMNLFEMFPDWDKMVDVKQNTEHHPEVYVDIHTSLVMDYAAKTWHDSEINFACLCHDFGKAPAHDKFDNFHGHEKEGLEPIKNFCEKWKVPNNYRNLALLVCENHTKIHGVLGRDKNAMMKPKSIMALFEKTKALTKPDRFEKILKACEADAKGRGGNAKEIEKFENIEYSQANYLRECLKAVYSLNTKELSSFLLSKGKTGPFIGEMIRVARIEKIREVYKLIRNNK